MPPIRARLSSLVAVVAATACFAVLAAPAGAATTTYPAGGSAFNTDAEGWTPGPSSCTPATVLCTPEAAYSPTVGNPPGSIAEQTTVTLNAVSLFKGTETWTSPQFAVPVGTITGASLQLQRAFDPGGLVEVAPTATYTVVLSDLTTGTTATLLSEGLTGADTTFATRSAPAAVIGGHSYRLTLEGVTAQSTLSLSVLSGTTAIRFDNVGLQVQSTDGGSGGGGGNGGGPGNSGGAKGGAVVSAGVRIVRGPYSDEAISKLIGSLNVNAEVGHHKGGSLVALSKCTIIGTPGRDRILGTKGNDVICGLGGNDLIKGRGGRDVIDGGNGNDRLIGGAKADLVLGLRGNDATYGNRGNDRLGAGRGNDRLGGGPGNDLLVGTRGNDHEFGGTGNDRLGGGPGNDRLIGGKGNDRLVGRKGVDRMFGGPGKDRLLARDHGRDVVNGGGGFDVGILDRLDIPHARNVERIR